MSRSGGGEDEVSYGDSNLRGRSGGKVNPAGGRIRGATGASNRRGAGRHNFFELCKKIVVEV